MIKSKKKTGKDTAQAKEMVRKEKVSGYEEFLKTIKDLYIGEKPPQINLLFTGEKNTQGMSWCPDCNNAEPHINKAISDYAKKSSIFVEVDVGNRDTYKDLNNPFRKDKDLRILEIPTLLRWNSPFRLEGEQCAKLGLLEMFFSEPSEED